VTAVVVGKHLEGDAAGRTVEIEHLELPVQRDTQGCAHGDARADVEQCARGDRNRVQRDPAAVRRRGHSSKGARGNRDQPRRDGGRSGQTEYGEWKAALPVESIRNTKSKSDPTLHVSTAPASTEKALGSRSGPELSE